MSYAIKQLFVCFLFVILSAKENSLQISKDVKSVVDDYYLPEDSVKAKLVDKSWRIIYKNLIPPLDSDFEIFGEKTIAIQNNSEQPWGVAADDKKSFEILHIDPGKQFENLGITIGWKITKVNDIRLSETNAEEFNDILIRGDACTLTFKSDDNQFALLQHQKSKELFLKTLKNDAIYDEYVTNVQIYLKKKQWREAYTPWLFFGKDRIQLDVPTNVHKILQHNLIDFIDVNGKLHPKYHPTLLSDAVGQWDIDFAKKLISRGAEVNAIALRSAVREGSAECTELLLETNPKVVNEKNEFCTTPLFHSLIEKSNVECAALLIKFGVNLQAKDETNNTALEKARYLQRKEHVKILTVAELVQKSLKRKRFEKFKNN